MDTNLEAAEEIARQIKIRDLSGLIIIDFIDMMSFGNRKQVERKLKERCRKDRARVQIGRISSFGLLEMSRQRLRESSVQWSISLTNQSFAQKIIKLIEVKSINSKAKIVNVNIPEKIKNFILDSFQKDLQYLEKKYKIKINLLGDKLLLVPEYEIFFENKSKKVLDKIEHRVEIKKILVDNKSKTNNVIKFVKKNFKKKKYLKKRKIK